LFTESSLSNGKKSKQNCKTSATQTEPILNKTVEASMQTEVRRQNTLEISIQTEPRDQKTIEASIQTEPRVQNTIEASSQTDSRVLGTAISPTNTSSDETENTEKSLPQKNYQNMPEATIETPALISNSLSFTDEVKNEDNNETDQLSNEEENITYYPNLQGENIQESVNKMESTGSFFFSFFLLYILYVLPYFYLSNNF
jgi:hypothetical protein